MAIEKLIYMNDRGESIEFSRLSKYHTNISKDVTGLADMKNELYSINSMGQDGDTYLGNRIESREIEIVGNINSRDKDETINLRRNLSRMLNPKVNAKMYYEYGTFRRVIDCEIDNAPIFYRDQVFLSFEIRLVCHNPFWKDEFETKTDIAAWIGAFHFPLFIPESEGMIFGYREPSLIANVINNGDVECGMRVDFRALGSVKNPSLLNIETQRFIKINYEMDAGDVLRVTTHYGNKDVMLIRNGIEISAVRYRDPENKYLQLETGDNLFRYDADADLQNLEVSVYHRNLYLGV